MVNLSLSYGMEDPRMSLAFFFFGFAVVAGGGEGGGIGRDHWAFRAGR